MADVVVIGGGIAGLTTAFALAGAGKDVVLLEERPVAGGNIRTHEQEGFRLESGPHSFMGSSEQVWRLLEELGAADEVEAGAAAAERRYIYRDGRLQALPTSLGAFLTSGVLSLGGKLRLALEPLIPSGAEPEETAWDFFSRRFGQEAATYIMSPFISGVYAGDIHALGARAAFPKFWNFERESGSMIRGALRYMKEKRRRYVAAGRPLRKGLYSFPGGLGGLAERVAGALGERVKLGVPVRSLEPRGGGGFALETGEGEVVSRAVVVATPPKPAAAILAGASPEAAALLRTVPMVPVALVHWTCAAEPGELPVGFGFLVPRVSGLRLLGTLFPAQIFAGRAPEGQALFASYYGGATDGAAATLPEEELTALLLEEHRKVFGVELEGARVLRVLRYDAAIPQLLPDHPERVAALWQAVAGLPGLTLAGNYLTGVGIEAAVESGYTAAARCLAVLEGEAAGAPELERGAA